MERAKFKHIGHLIEHYSLGTKEKRDLKDLLLTNIITNNKSKYSMKVFMSNSIYIYIYIYINIYLLRVQMVY